MESKQDYLAKLQVAVSQLHNCGATWRETVPVHEVFQGKTVWQGDVEVFDLHGHPKAKRAYAWNHLDGANDERTRFVAVLEIPPVESAALAVRVQIVKDVKDGKEKYKIELFEERFGCWRCEVWVGKDCVLSSKVGIPNDKMAVRAAAIRLRQQRDYDSHVVNEHFY